MSEPYYRHTLNADLTTYCPISQRVEGSVRMEGRICSACGRNIETGERA